MAFYKSVQEGIDISLCKMSLSKCVRQGTNVFSSSILARCLSAQAQTSEALKPYHEIPGLPDNGLPFVGNFLKIQEKPHGIDRFYLNLERFMHQYSEGTGMLRLRSSMVNGREGAEGRIVWLFKPELVEAVARAEGKQPNRGTFFDCLKKWKYSRPDLFEDNAGVLLEDDDKWYEVRSKVQQDMMRPKSAMLYIEPLEEIIEEFIEATDRKLASSPDGVSVNDFTSDLYSFALEAVTMIALDQHLGAFKKEVSPESKELVHNVKEAIEAMTIVLLNPPYYKLSPWLSPTYRKMCLYMDLSAKFIHVIQLLSIKFFLGNPFGIYRTKSRRQRKASWLAAPVRKGRTSRSSRS